MSTDLFAAAQPREEIKRYCDACGQEIDLQRDSWRMTKTGVKHATCPTSPALANLPAMADPEPAQPQAAAAAGPVFLTMDEAAKLLHVSKDTIRNRIKAGQLPAVRLRGGQTVLINRADVLALLEPYTGEG